MGNVNWRKNHKYKKIWCQVFEREDGKMQCLIYMGEHIKFDGFK
jgi:hypothetical protein